MRLPAASLLVSAATALVASIFALTAHAAYDFAGRPELTALGSCTSAKAGTVFPTVDKAKTNMTRNDISIAAYTVPVVGRKVVMYLGKNATNATCFAEMVGNEDSCRYEYMLAGTWASLRGCGWSAADRTSRKGYEVRNNTVFLEWQDLYSDGKRQNSKYSYPVSIALPTAVQLETNVKILEDSGIKNFNLTGLSFNTESGEGRFVYIDFMMYSRWPNNLTLAENASVTLPNFAGNVTVVQYSLPTCVKTDGSNSTVFTTDDFCWQSGQVKIDVGPQCNVGGAYSFNFDTHCFPNAGTNDCNGKVLSANAYIGDADENGDLTLDLCGGLIVDTSDVTAIMVSDMPLSYRMVPRTVTTPPYMTWGVQGPIVDLLKLTTSNTNCTLGGPNINFGVPKKCAVFVDVSRGQDSNTRYFIVATVDGGLIKMALVIFQTNPNGFYYLLAWNGKYYAPPSPVKSLTAAIIQNAYANGVDNGAAYSTDITFSYSYPEPIVPTVPLAKRQTDGYQFGDTIKLTVLFDSPQLPIYESRLTKLILGRNQVQRFPAVGANTTFNRNHNTTIVESAGGPFAVGAISPLGINSNFTYIPGSDVVNMTMIPNMMPRDSNTTDYSDLSFLTTDDFDSVTDYTFYATFRVYFDQMTANGQRRRRRLLTRDVNVPASSMRQSSSLQAQLTKPFTGPRSEPEFFVTDEPQQASSTSSPYLGLYIGLGVACAVFAVGNCVLCALFLVQRKKDRKRHEVTMEVGGVGQYTKMMA